MQQGDGKDQQNLADRAERLFRFLTETQRLNAAQVLNVDSYKRADGLVLPLATTHAVNLTFNKGATLGSPVLTIDRVPRVEHPELPSELLGHIEGDLADCHADVQPKRQEEEDEEPAQEVVRYLELWSQWAESERSAQIGREAYHDLFTAYTNARDRSEDLELVIGAGRLDWKHDKGVIRRHLLARAAVATFDSSTGRVSISLDSDASTDLEIADVLSPAEVLDNESINKVRSELADDDVNLVDPSACDPILRRLVNGIHSEAQLIEAAIGPTETPAVSWEPTLILRKKSNRSWITMFERIVEQIDETGFVPAGVQPLIDPAFQPPRDLDWTGEAGATVTQDEDVFLPLPVNDAQLRVIQEVSRSPQVLVQGPPGTGKTHTAAALLSDLLAKGKRVLITAQTERALLEIREKLPEEIRNLSVAVIGNRQEDKADLRAIVSNLADRATEHEATDYPGQIAKSQKRIDELLAKRSQIRNSIAAVREHEIRSETVGSYQGTRAQLALQASADRVNFEWIEQLPAGADPGITGVEALSIIDGYLSPEVGELGEAALDVADESPLSPPAEVGDWLTKLNTLERITGGIRVQDTRSKPEYSSLSGLDSSVLSEIERLLTELSEISGGETRVQDWETRASEEIAAGATKEWSDRLSVLESRLDQVDSLQQRMGKDLSVSTALPFEACVTPAESLLTYLNGGGKVPTKADGAVKVGFTTNSTIKQLADFIDGTRVDGRVLDQPERVQQFLSYCEAWKLLDLCDRDWPAWVEVSEEDTVSERSSWHRSQLARLELALSHGSSVSDLSQELSALAGMEADWSDATIRSAVANAARLRLDEFAVDEANEPIEQLRFAATSANETGAYSGALAALEARDLDRYTAEWERDNKLRSVKVGIDQVKALLGRADPALADLILDHATDPAWRERFAQLEDAIAWRELTSWIRAQESIDLNTLEEELDEVEDALRHQCEVISSARAWSAAAGPSRIGPGERAVLTQYVKLVAKLGKGTGKYANQRRADIRDTLDRCRSSVPVWIMPINRVVEQLRIEPNMFDVVIIDEASQADMSACFLQYLAPKMVVIGDDQQVSPMAVGINQQDYAALANEYLHDDPFIASWKDPTTSLFDEARVRFGTPITLTEHRRCRPEIIGFSNLIAYEPINQKLMPVRPSVSGGLEPIVPVLVEDAYRKGKDSFWNPVEAERIVEQIQNCNDDPRYDGMTFGIISLQGELQQKKLNDMLLDQVAPEVWEKRDLRVGKSTDFQGSERDVIFISMVAVADGEKRLAAQTRSSAVQRYNVAASRAKEQMWVFHSVELEDLTNQEDLRWRLLRYCYDVARRSNETVAGAVTERVAEDSPVEPFGSLFEQRVFNRLVDAGYTVVPQYPAMGYRIDLVVVDGDNRLAIECDGDFWHDASRFEADLARQRNLQRCGWKFHRVRDSDFYSDPAESMRQTYEALAQHGITSAALPTS